MSSLIYLFPLAFLNLSCRYCTAVMSIFFYCTVIMSIFFTSQVLFDEASHFSLCMICHCVCSSNCTMDLQSTVFTLHGYWRSCRYNNWFFECIIVDHYHWVFGIALYGKHLSIYLVLANQLHVFVLPCFQCITMVLDIVINDCVLLIFGIIPLIGLLNSSVAGLGSPYSTGIDLICNKPGFTPVLVSKHFFIVYLTNLYMSPLGHCFSAGMKIILLALYSVSCRNNLISLEQKLVFPSDIILLGSQDSANVILQPFI